MNVVPMSYSSNVFWKELVFLESRVGAEEKTAHLKGRVTAQRRKFDALWTAERDMEFEVADTQAQTRTAEVRVNSCMEDAYATALFKVKQKRKDPRYSKLFKVSHSAFKQMGFSAQKEDIVRMKELLELDMYDDDFRDAMNLVLDRAVAEIDRIVALQKQLDRKRVFHRQDVDAFKNETNELRQDVYGELMQLSDTPGEGWARSFFPLQKRAKKLTEQQKAKQEAKRLEKRAKKTADKLAIEVDRLEKAREKERVETAKAEAEERERQAAKERADKKRREREEKKTADEKAAREEPATDKATTDAPVAESSGSVANGKLQEPEMSEA